MKETLLQYAGYNVWANNRIIDVMLKLGTAAVDKEMPGSFPTIRTTVYHIWSAEYIWLQRLQLLDQPRWAASSFEGHFEEACLLWKQVSSDLLHFVSGQYNDASFGHVLQYYNRKSQPFKNKVGDVLLHVFNHGTYHRGQLVTMLRTAGVQQIPATDFIVYIRK